MGHIFNTRGYNAPFTGGHILGGIEGETTGSKRTCFFAVKFCSVSLTGIFYEGKIVFLADGFYFGNIKGLPEQVNTQNCFGIWGDFFFYQIWVEVEA